MNVLLTGATGWVGSHVAKELVSRGHTVLAIVRPGSSKERISSILNKILVREGEFDEVDGLKFDVAVHAAWYVDPKDYLTSRENVACLERSRRLLEITEDCGARAVFLGSCFEYDTHVGVLSEKSPLKPDSLYASCKDLLRFAMEGHPNGAWLRLFYQFGPWEKVGRFIPSVINAMISKRKLLVTKGHHRRDYLHIEDVAAAIVHTAESKITGCVNIGSGRAPSVREMVGFLGSLDGGQETVHLSDLFKADEPVLIQADNEVLRSTGWTPKYTLDAALRNTFEWWRDCGIRPV